MTLHEKLIWAAGFLDGEGYISVTKANMNGNRATPSYRPEISAAQVHREPLDVLVELFGGRVLYTNAKSGGHWYWRLYCAKALPVVQRLLPYLVAKRTQAALVLEFGSLIHERGKSVRYIPEHELIRRREIFDQLKAINQRRTRAERLSEEAPPQAGGAIVRPAGNENRQSQEEIPGRLRIIA